MGSVPGTNGEEYGLAYTKRKEKTKEKVVCYKESLGFGNLGAESKLQSDCYDTKNAKWESGFD